VIINILIIRLMKNLLVSCDFWVRLDRNSCNILITFIELFEIFLALCIDQSHGQLTGEKPSVCTAADIYITLNLKGIYRALVTRRYTSVHRGEPVPNQLFEVFQL